MTEKTKTEKAAAAKAHAQMLISYTPGEECRVAVVEDGKLEEFHAERASSISRVGNIYIGTVTNVEPAIQAAFVDFGVEHHGFLHVTDVHPRYFPGEDDDTTERVGKKTPRRERPPIQRCFRRGDQVEVQVLKEGVGTKGPTLTSYLSIPGRFLVMMPQMDRVGVSRKVEDEDQRRAMRQILDQLELPEGFGFIVRTAGMDRNKTELKRDLAYLQRLWKDMEARRRGGNKPRLLYSESDLLVRALRDMVGSEIEEIIIDNDLALARAARFLKIVAPRSKIKLLQYSGQTPLFHAFGIEQQLALMHAREVPLPSGGRLVIDETEALVAIDVNSGKMRDARDAETNAYRTNCEAVEEICRQLKLRDLGGIVINDLIDMRHVSHRKDIEQRFRDRLKRDRARTTTLAISDFGILEMTRQRMRGSHESVHFVDCPTCRGRGMVQKPDSVASDALRNLAALVDHERVARVEMVVSPRVASELLSGRRKSLNKIERSSGRHVDVRVSETVAVDRVTFYAYDPQGADIDVEALPKSKPPSDLKAWELHRGEEDEAWAADLTGEQTPPEPDLTPAEQAEIEEMPAHPIEFDVEDEASAPGVAAPAGPNGEGGEGGEGGRRRRRRRRRGRGGRGEGQDQSGQPQQGHPQQAHSQLGQPHAPPHAGDQHAGGQGYGDAQDRPEFGSDAAGPHGRNGEHDAPQGDSQQPGEGGEGGRRRRRRRRRGRGGAPDGQQPPFGVPPVQPGQPQVFEEPPRGDSWDVPASAIRPLPAPTGLPGGADTTQDEIRGAPEVGEPVPVAPEQPRPTLELVTSNESDDAEDEAPLVTGEAGAGPAPGTDDGQGQGEGGRRRRRRRRGGRGRSGNGEGSPPQQGQAPGAPRQQPESRPQPAQRPPQQSRPPQQNRPPQQPRPQQPARAPHGDRGPRPQQGGPARPPQPPSPAQPPRDVRTGGGYQKRSPGESAPPPPVAEPKPVPPAAAPLPTGSAPAPKPKRLLFVSRRRLSPGEIPRGPRE